MDVVVPVYPLLTTSTLYLIAFCITFWSEKWGPSLMPKVPRIEMLKESKEVENGKEDTPPQLTSRSEAVVELYNNL